MQIRLRIRWLTAVTTVVVAGAAAGATVGDALSHPDTGGPARVNDSVTLTEVTALTDQDDGVNGLSEYCVRVTIVHPDHIGESESVECVDVNWDDKDRSGKTWEELGSLPLIGPGGYAGSSWESVDHTNECVESAPWTMRTRLTESNTFGLADILDAIGQSLAQAKEAGATGGKLFLYGEAAKIAAKVLRELFQDLDNLGSVPLKWEAGEGDPGGVVKKGPDEARHFKAAGEKTVTRVSPDCTSYTLPTNPMRSAQTAARAAAAPVGRTGQAVPCGSDPRHVFCKGARRARRSWQRLDLAARRIGRLRQERGAPRANVRGMKRDLIRLVGVLARYSTRVEVSEARKMSLGLNGRMARARAVRQLRSGQVLTGRAARRVSPRLLRRALSNYRAAHLGLLPITHRGFNR